MTKKKPEGIDSAIEEAFDEISVAEPSAAGSSAAELSATEPPNAAAAADEVAQREIVALATALAAEKEKRLRDAADFENAKKRHTRERLEAEAMGMRVMAKGLLDALDDLGRFAHLDPATTDAKTVVEGAAMVEKKLLKSLAGHGLELVNPVDAAFDPAFHEALTTVPAASKDEDHMVAQVYQVGYVFNGQLLRPARVVVKQWRGEQDAPSGMVS